MKNMKRRAKTSRGASVSASATKKNKADKTPRRSMPRATPMVRVLTGQSDLRSQCVYAAPTSKDFEKLAAITRAITHETHIDESH
jgi:hypothetical protein